MMVGREICPTTGTPHLQGAVSWEDPKRLAAVKKLLTRAHWGITWCTKGKGKDKPFTYCAEDGDVVYNIDNRRQGKRSDLDDVYKMCKAGASMSDIMETEPPYQAARTAELYMKHVVKKRKISPREILWYHGPPGSGKSYAAHTEHGESYFSKSPGKWWDGYAGEKTVIFDDFRPTWFSLDEFLRLTDIYHVRGEIKGGTLDLPYEKLIITCVWPPQEAFAGMQENIQQVLRRITQVREFKVT